ncbi:amidohydrolase [Alteromonas gracilis]|uniref:amidohydrolase n=1 Tax=Alteromonas gracilis TaxID=1479524 RepID=UPI0030D2C12A
MKRLSVIVLLIGLISGCGQAPDTAPEQQTESSKKVVYHGGPILTMAGDKPEYAEAVVIEGETIVFVGSTEDAFNQAGVASEKIDLNGQTLVPGFIDGHAHFSNFASQAIYALLLPSPDANVNSVNDAIDTLQDWNTPENRAYSGWIVGTGFDDSVIEEKRFLTKHDLDKVSTEHPVMVLHISGHFAIVNSVGLEKLGIDKNTPDPEGGLIRREPGGTEPNGVLEELAAIPYMMQALSPTSPEALMRFFDAGQEMALSYGYTTAQEGRAMENHELLVSLAEQGAIKLDVVSYIDYAHADKYMSSKWNSKTYINNYRIGGMKVTLDGSPQGRTAWRTKPYLISPLGAEEDYAGYPAIPSDIDLSRIYRTAFEKGWQTLSHANGDAAMDQMIRTLRPLVEEFSSAERRDVLIHGQYVRDDQLDAFKELGVIASLFPLHTYYWGDWHSQLIGEELGMKISPVRTALNKGLKVTIHTDAPVALPNLMRVVWTAVNRTSRSGKIIGEAERLTPYEALQAITIWSAYQHFEEETKGTIEKGKIADLVVLDKNPLTVEPDDIQHIQVMKTIKSGQLLFER